METLRIHYRGPLPRKNEKRQPGIRKNGTPYIYVQEKIQREHRGIKDAIGWTAKAAAIDAGLREPFPGPLEVKIVWRFKNSSDVDRPEEVTLDALEGAAYVNDRQVKHLVQLVDESEKWGEDEAIILVRPFDGTTQEEKLLEENHDLRARIDKLLQEKYDWEKATREAGLV